MGSYNAGGRHAAYLRSYNLDIQELYRSIYIYCQTMVPTRDAVRIGEIGGQTKIVAKQGMILSILKTIEDNK